MQTVQNRQKSYVDQRRRRLEFTMGDQVILKIAPMKGVMRFAKKGKLSQDILVHLLLVRELEMSPTNLTFLHQCLKYTMCFHVSMLRKYIGNPSHVLKNEPMEIKPDLTYEEKPIEILQREIK